MSCLLTLYTAGAVVPPTRPPGTFFYGLMFWLQMGRHKQEDGHQQLARSPPVIIEEEFRKEQRDSTCVTEPQQWQEERQAQLCLARMPAAVVPDTRPRCHRLRRTEGHYACTPQEQQPLYDLFLRRLARPARPALNSRTHGSHRWLAVVLERTDTAERHHRATRPFAIFRDLPLKGG